MAKIWQRRFVKLEHFAVFVKHLVAPQYRTWWENFSCSDKLMMREIKPVDNIAAEQKVLKKAQLSPFLVVLWNKTFHKRHYTVFCIKIRILMRTRNIQTLVSKAFYA